MNLGTIVAIDEALLSGGVLQDGVLRDGGRIVCLSSISGVAGNAGQTNYATTKAALIGYAPTRRPDSPAAASPSTPSRRASSKPP